MSNTQVVWPNLPCEVRQAVGVIWKYHRCGAASPAPADLLLVTGSHDLSVAEYAAEVSRQFFFPVIVISGGLGKVTQTMGYSSEAERFYSRMADLGAPAERILLEKFARNSGENFSLTRNLLESRGLRPASGLIVTKPYMERRMYATAHKQWPDVLWQVTSSKCSLDEYMDYVDDPRLAINLMVGDLQRLVIYAERGFSSPQDIPETVLEAFEFLVSEGYDSQVIS